MRRKAFIRGFINGLSKEKVAEFVTKKVWRSHFAKHKNEFPDIKSPEAYRESAMALAQDKSKNIKRWKEGDRTIHYNTLTGEKVVTAKNGKIISYYKV